MTSSRNAIRRSRSARTSCFDPPVIRARRPASRLGRTTTETIETRSRRPPPEIGLPPFPVDRRRETVPVDGWQDRGGLVRDAVHIEGDVGTGLRDGRAEGAGHVRDERLVRRFGVDSGHDERGHHVAVAQHDDVIPRRR